MEKQCTKCKSVKSIDDFSNKKTAKDGKSTMCKVCTREYTKDHYQKNKKYYREKADRYKTKMKEWFKEFKSKLSCNRCGEDRWWVLDFHHSDPKDKEYNMSDLIHSRGKEVFMKEFEKCEVLCSNCHRDHHHQERNNK